VAITKRRSGIQVAEALGISHLSRPFEADTWCAIRLLASSPLATLKIEDQPPPSRETRGAESAFEDRHKVTARGHLGVIERTAQKAEAPGLAAEGITMFSRCQFNLISILIPARSE
jgi:hypothetical protein